MRNIIIHCFRNNNTNELSYKDNAYLNVFCEFLFSIVVLNLFFPLILSADQSNLNETIFETRAIFDEGLGWITEEGARKTIQRIKKAGFNVYIPCVWHGRGTRYPSTLAPIDVRIKSTSEDPLHRLIKISHES